jgi:hypothetical protein
MVNVNNEVIVSRRYKLKAEYNGCNTELYLLLHFLFYILYSTFYSPEGG